MKPHTDRRTLLKLAGASAIAASLPRLAVAQSKDELTIAYNVNLPSWDPTTGPSAVNPTIQGIYQSVFDQFIPQKPDLSFAPGLLTEWGWNDDRTKGNLWATIGPADIPGVILSGHSDVVPVDGQAWISDPFILREADGRVYGRGACDMKGFVGIVLAGSGCAPQQESGSGPGHRQQHLGLSTKKEYELGVQAYQQILDEARQKDALLPADSPATRRVRRVGERIVEAVKIEPLQREINLNLKGYRFEWEFNVLRSRQINAFCLPAGKVAVFTGLLRVVANDDQLATVLAHEIAHALAHHANERVTRQGNWLFNKAYDRQQESEADHIGLFLMTFAGYDPDETVAFWQRMRQAQRGGELPEILSDHPSDRRRIQQLQAWVPQAKAAKVAYDHHRIAASR